MKQFFAVLILAVFSFNAQAESPKFVKLDESFGKPVALKVALVKYKDKTNRSVTLVSAIHIADKQHYEKLNVIFKRYEVVCYELVISEKLLPRIKGKGLPKSKGESQLAWMQTTMGEVLGLSHQTKVVDYSPDNFVHADLTQEKMAKIMAERGDNQLTIILGVLADSLRKQNLDRMRGVEQPEEEVDIIKLARGFLINPVHLKRMMAPGLSDVNSVGPTLERILIQDRNEEAMSVVKKQLSLGKKDIALYYGAAHNADFHKRLVAHGFSVDSIEWETAWDMKVTEEELMFDLLQELLMDKK